MQESTERVKESRLSGQRVQMGPHTDKFSDPGKEERRGMARLAHLALLAQLGSLHPYRSCGQLL